MSYAASFAVASLPSSNISMDQTYGSDEVPVKRVSSNNLSTEASDEIKSVQDASYLLSLTFHHFIARLVTSGHCRQSTLVAISQWRLDVSCTII